MQYTFLFHRKGTLCDKLAYKFCTWFHFTSCPEVQCLFPAVDIDCWHHMFFDVISCNFLFSSFNSSQFSFLLLAATVCSKVVNHLSLLYMGSFFPFCFFICFGILVIFLFIVLRVCIILMFAFGWWFFPFDSLFLFSVLVSSSLSSNTKSIGGSFKLMGRSCYHQYPPLNPYHPWERQMHPFSLQVSVWISLQHFRSYYPSTHWVFLSCPKGNHQ